MASSSSSWKPTGRGVTHYDPNAVASHSITTTTTTTTTTTEFDDALLRRGIVTPYQVMAAKGASPAHAAQLAEDYHQRQQQQQQQPQQQQQQQQQQQPQPQETTKPFHPRTDSKNNNNTNDDDDDSFLDNDEEDSFVMDRYRQERLAELEQFAIAASSTSSSSCNSIRHISRNDWTVHVNEASHEQWVWVTLLDRTHQQEILQELHRFSQQQSSSIQMVTIHATEAVPNWPAARTPAVFMYRHGVKQHEWVAPRNGAFLSVAEWTELLVEHWNVIPQQQQQSQQR